MQFPRMLHVGPENGEPSTGGSGGSATSHLAPIQLDLGCTELRGTVCLLNVVVWYPVRQEA